jgi:Ca2+-binding RTX toxin-like protein
MAPIPGTSGDDELVGTDDADTIEGFAGEDEIEGRGGDDTILGGADAVNLWPVVHSPDAQLPGGAPAVAGLLPFV